MSDEQELEAGATGEGAVDETATGETGTDDTSATLNGAATGETGSTGEAGDLGQLAEATDLEAVEATETIEVAKYKIVGLVDMRDEQMNITGQFPIGSIQELPVSVGTQLVADGFVEAVADEGDVEAAAE